MLTNLGRNRNRFTGRIVYHGRFRQQCGQDGVSRDRIPVLQRIDHRCSRLRRGQLLLNFLDLLRYQIQLILGTDGGNCLVANVWIELNIRRNSRC